VNPCSSQKVVVVVLRALPEALVVAAVAQVVVEIISVVVQ
jgi:hypothetical protein